MSCPTDAKHLKKLFSSGGQKPDVDAECQRLSYCLRHELVSCRKESYSETPEPTLATHDSRQRVFERAGHGPGGPQHGLLKWWAWNWCLKTYGEEPEFEVEHMDVYAPNAGIQMECGSTHPSHAYFRFGSGRLKAFVLFPMDQSNSLYIFEPTEKGLSVLSVFSNWKIELAVWGEGKYHNFLPRPKNPGEPGNLGEDDFSSPMNASKQSKHPEAWGGWRGDGLSGGIVEFRWGEWCASRYEYVNAYAWFEIAAALCINYLGDVDHHIVEARNDVADRITDDETALAKQRANAMLAAMLIGMEDDDEEGDV